MRRLGLVVAMLCVAGTGEAKPRYTRAPTLHITVQLTDDVLPADTSKPLPAMPAVALQLPDPYGAARPSDEQVLVELIAATPDKDADEKAAIYHRLGSLYAKQSMTFHAQGDTQKSKAFLIKAVKVYKTLIDTDAYKRYPKMDVALYQYGYALYDSRFMKEARAVFDQLLKNYPNSAYVPQAHLVFAEYYLENNQLADAEPRLAEVVKFPKSVVYAHALFRLAWVQLQEAKFQNALDGFTKAAEATAGDAAKRELFEASEKGLVRAYAEVGKADAAFAAFDAVSSPGAIDMYAALADTYAATGRSDSAVTVYRDLIQRDPKSPHACAWKYGIARAVTSAPDRVKEIEDLTRLWTALSTSKAVPADEVQACRDHAADLSGELARAWHAEATKTRNIDTFGYAVRLYRAYLDAFPGAPDRAEDEYLFAEASWARAELEQNAKLQASAWQQASDAFAVVMATNKVDAATLKEAEKAAIYAKRNSEQP